MSGCPALATRLIEPKQERSRKTWRTILQTAAGLFAAQGYDQVSTNAVAAAAGISIGSLYRYFPDKQSILAALVEQEADELHLAMDRLLAPGAPLPGFSQILDGLIDPLTAKRDQPRLCLRMLAASAASPELTSITRALDARMVDFISRVIQRLHPATSPELAQVRGRTCITIVDAMAARIEAASTPAQAAALIAELKGLLLAWLEGMSDRQPNAT